MASLKVSTWMFTTGVGLLAWGAYQAGDGLMASPVAGDGIGLGVAMLLGGAALASLGMRAWAHQRL